MISPVFRKLMNWGTLVLKSLQKNYKEKSNLSMPQTCEEMLGYNVSYNGPGGSTTHGMYAISGCRNPTAKTAEERGCDAKARLETVRTMLMSGSLHIERI